MTTFHLTHRGWFGFCPVHLSDPDGCAPMIVPIHWILHPLFWLSELWFELCFTAYLAANLDPPGWPLRVDPVPLASPRVITADWAP